MIDLQEMNPFGWINRHIQNALDLANIEAEAMELCENGKVCVRSFKDNSVGYVRLRFNEFNESFVAENIER
jgi:hypothetical protein